jgi:uncharacterized BrkB/YihY/UPF0761 family membrane protein
MLWFYVTAALLLIGAEVTAALTRELSPGEIRRRGEEQAAAEALGGAAEDAKRSVKGVANRPAS